MNSGADRPLLVARLDRAGSVVRLPDVDACISHIREHAIGVFIVDPFVETHEVNENSNEQIKAVAVMFREIARKGDCAVMLIHHTAKPPQGASVGHAGNMNTARGASALTGVARIVQTLFAMSARDAEAFGIPDDERHLYIRLDDAKANLGLTDLCFTDPPYNVEYGNSAKDKMRGKERSILNDNLGESFERFLYDACVNILTVTKGATYICMSSSELHTLQKAFKEAGGHWSTFVIWAKNTFTLGRADYQRQYEPILYGWKEGDEHFWCGAQDQGDVWFVDKPRKNDLHPTMKPVALVERAVRNSSKSRDIVLDPFGGSGTTLIACEKAGRSARLVELDSKYVDVICRRWQNWTGETATLEGDGRTFDEITAWRDTVAVG